MYSNNMDSCFCSHFAAFILLVVVCDRICACKNVHFANKKFETVFILLVIDLGFWDGFIWTWSGLLLTLVCRGYCYLYSTPVFFKT